MIRSVAHVCLKTKDLEKTLLFYEQALGLRRQFNFTRAGEVIGFYLAAENGTTFVEVFESDAPEPTSTGNVLSHFCLQTEAIEEVRRRLLESGFAPGEIMMGADETLQFWVDDPNGLAVEFQQYTAESTQMTGRDVAI